MLLEVKQTQKKVVDELIAKGYDAHALPLNRFGLIPVAFGSFNSLSEAQKLKKKLNKTNTQKLGC